jgi:hypothetical protein
MLKLIIYETQVLEVHPPFEVILEKRNKQNSGLPLVISSLKQMSDSNPLPGNHLK